MVKQMCGFGDLKSLEIYMMLIVCVCSISKDKLVFDLEDQQVLKNYLTA